MTDRDPYEEDMDIEPVGKSGKKKAPPAEDDEGPSEGAGLDLVLAYQPCTDFGNATRLQQRFGDDLVYVDKNGWFAWDGTRWDREGGQYLAARMAHRVMLAIKDEARAVKEARGRSAEDRVAQLHAWAKLSGSSSRTPAMLDMAKNYMLKPLSAFDADDMLVAAPNCTIMLKSLVETKRNDRRDYITRKLGVPFVEGADCPLWHRFLERVMPDQDMRDFLQRIAGYCLTGSNKEQCMFFFYGTGSNGKSTFVSLLRHILGDYVMNSPVETFLAKNGNGGAQASPDLARLVGIRMLTASEPSEGARLNEGAIKGLTGSEVITARHLNEGFFEFTPKFKLVISTNHYPTIRGTDVGIWRRIRLVPWTVSIPDEEKDLDLEKKLLAEAPGILQWMLTGLEDWLQRGLDPPEKAKAAVEDYKAAQDPVGEFLSSVCAVTGDMINPGTGKQYETSAERMRKAYVAWCQREGLEAMSGKSFGMKLAGKGIQKRKSGGLTVYVGVHVEEQMLGL